MTQHKARQRKNEWWGKPPKQPLCCQLNGKYICGCCKFKFCSNCFKKLAAPTLPIKGCGVYGGITRDVKFICTCCCPFAEKVRAYKAATK